MGPYVTAALLCENILHEPDGAFSAIRIFDKYVLLSADSPHINLLATRPAEISGPPTFNLPVMLKSGD